MFGWLAFAEAGASDNRRGLRWPSGDPCDKGLSYISFIVTPGFVLGNLGAVEQGFCTAWEASGAKGNSDTFTLTSRKTGPQAHPKNPYPKIRGTLFGVLIRRILL